MISMDPASLSVTSGHPLSHTIPWEILTSIIEQVDDLPTLCQLSLVSSAVLEPAGRALWRNVELKTAQEVLLFFHSPTLIPPSSRLRPFVGLPLLLNLSLNLPRKEYPTTGLPTLLVAQPASAISSPLPSTPDRLLSLPDSQPLPLNTLSFSASDRDAAIDESLRLYLPHLNPRRLVLTTTPPNQIIFFIPNVRQSRGLRADFGRWDRLEEVVMDGAALVEFPPTGMFGAGGMKTTLLPCVKGLFGEKGVPKMIFDLRRGRREGWEVWAGVNVARSWGKFVSWLEECGVRDTEGIREGGVEVLVSEEEDEGIVKEAVRRLVREETRGRYKVVLRR